MIAAGIDAGSRTLKIVVWDAEVVESELPDPDSTPGLPDRKDMMAPEDVAEAVLFVATRPESIRVPLLQIERS